MRMPWDGHERAIRAIAVGVTVLLTALGVVRYRRAWAESQHGALPASRVTRAAATGWSRDSLHSAVATALASGLFDGTRRGETRALVRPTVPPAQTHPGQLRLNGILGGPPWSAVITGFPSHPGAVLVSPGDTVNGFVLVRVVRDTALLRANGRIHPVTWAP